MEAEFKPGDRVSHIYEGRPDGTLLHRDRSGCPHSMRDQNWLVKWDDGQTYSAYEENMVKLAEGPECQRAD